MPVRGSFQKRQKESERREKRQLKLDRRQGKAPARTSSEPTEPDQQNGDSDLPQVSGVESVEPVSNPQQS
jgi:hypothetical protein